MQCTVQELAALVQGTVRGDDARTVQAVSTFDDADSGDLIFVDSAGYPARLPDCQASAVVVPAPLIEKYTNQLDRLPATLSLIVVADALTAFVKLARHLRGDVDEAPTGIDPRACVHPTATVGPDASIHAFAVVGANAVIGARCRLHAGVVIGKGCRIGDDVTLHPHVVLYDGVTLGHRVMLHAHAVLGADGFGYHLHEGRHVKMPQLGHVEIGDEVEIGAGTTIDRGTLEPTRVGAGTKIDNLVQIGHNCQIGAHNVFAGQVGMAGSCGTGVYVTVAGQAGIADHLRLSDHAVIGARSAVTRDVPPGARVIGMPAKPEMEFKRMLHAMHQLPDLLREVRAIKRQLGLDEPTKAAG